MKGSGRYATSQLTEDQREPGSKGKVLKNLLGLTSQRAMDRTEWETYRQTYSRAVRQFGKSHRFSAQDLCELHRLWLKSIYSWAGRYRQVDLTREGFRFAHAKFIPTLMREFEQGPLACYTPCQVSSPEKLAQALAVVHVELVLIHPFREGNGRLARLLAVLMGLQAGVAPLDFSGIAKGRGREAYFKAVRRGMDRDYAPMAQIFRDVLVRTSRVLLRK